MTKIAAIFYVNATQVYKTQFNWSSLMEWPGINQSAAIFLPPCALAYDVMPFCVDANRMTTGEVVPHLLINLPLFLTMGTQCLPQGVSTLRSGRDMMSTRISGHC